MRTRFLIFVCIVMINCSYAQSVNLKLRNKTGFTIDSIDVGTFKIPGMLPDSLCKTFYLSEITLDSGHPIFYGRIMVGGKWLENEPVFRCGTSEEEVQSGNFVFEVVFTEPSYSDVPHTVLFRGLRE